MTTKEIDFCKNVYSTMQTYVGLDVAVWISAQFGLESKFGTSNLASLYQNFCGMRYPKKRPFLGLGSTSAGFAKYFDFINCCYDYLYWLFYHRDCPDLLICTADVFSDYVVNKWKYCLDDGYLEAVNKIYVQLKIHLK